MQRIDVATGTTTTLYTPQHQLGWIASSPSGLHAAVVEAICSDRTVVAGDIVVLPTGGGVPRRLGHANIATTNTYVHAEDDVRHDATSEGHRAGWTPR